MAFNTLEFPIFLLGVLAAHGILLALDAPRARKWLLLAVSYAFYMAWNPPFVLLLIASTLLDYRVALALEAELRATRRRLLLSLSVIGNLGVLAYFKYGAFAAESVGGILGMPELGSAWGGWVLPVGISFYTFQSMSYSIDVYRGRLPAATRFGDFALYVAFFPQLVAGPIVRAGTFLPQIAAKPKVTAEDIEIGTARMMGGFVKKIVLADGLGRYCDAVFANVEAYQGPTLWLAIFAYAYQIYFDFSGYTDIAIGTARLFGFRLPENFDRPYLAASPREFWNRWHISLSTWLRDYLYISLGGNRFGWKRTYASLFITMLLGGLWHGAAWNFVLWGAFHGTWLAIHRVLTRDRAYGPPRTPLPLRQIATFLLVCAGWVIFRVESLDDIGYVFANLWTVESIWTLKTAIACALLPLAVGLHLSMKSEGMRRLLLGWPPLVQGVAYAVAVLLFSFVSPATGRFIYFQF